MERTCEASSSSTERTSDWRPTPGPEHRYQLDRRVRRLGRAGQVLLGGEPFRLVRLSENGALALDGLVGAAPEDSAAPGAAGAAGEQGVGSGPGGPEHLARRLVASAILHPIPVRRSARDGEIVVVVPVRDDAGRLARLLHALRGDYRGDLVVVDDGSSEVHGAADRIAEVTARLSGILVRRPVAGGPATARNAGGSAAGDARLLAFVDADVTPEPGWLDGLVGHFDDEQVGAVAPRVQVRSGADRIGGALAAYESVRSPLDLGAEPGMVGSHRRVSYVPSAAMLCRRAALDAVGWFDADLRVGEDVDLVRRLEAAGWVVRYEPRVRVRHDARGGFSAFARQRFSYGTSAAQLERRHPGTVAPYEGTWWGVTAPAAALVFAAAAAALGPTGGTLGTGWDTGVPYRPASRLATPRRRAAITGAGAGMAWLVATVVPARKLRAMLEAAGVPAPTTTAVALITKGQLSNAAGLATALRRTGWPPALVASALGPGPRRWVMRLMAVCELAGGINAWHRARRPADEGVAAGGLAATLAIGLLDDVSYGAGVWLGCIRQRSVRAVLPRVAPKHRQTQAD